MSMPCIATHQAFHWLVYHSTVLLFRGMLCWWGPVCFDLQFSLPTLLGFAFLSNSLFTMCNFLPSTHFGHNSTCSLMTSLVCFIVVNSLIISAVKTSVMPLIKWLLSLLSFYLYLHSGAFILILPIHSSDISWLFLFNNVKNACLQYLRDSIVSLFCGLKFSIQFNMNSPCNVWHNSCWILLALVWKEVLSSLARFLWLILSLHK